LEENLVEEILLLAEKDILALNPYENRDEKIYLKLDYKFEEYLLGGTENLLLKEKIRECISQRKISLFYQPIVSIFEGSTYGWNFWQG